MTSYQDLFKKAIINVAKESYGERIIPLIFRSNKLSNGDYTSNVAMVFFRKLGEKSPLVLAEKLAEKLKNSSLSSVCSQIVAVIPGFINFTISEDQLVNQVSSLLRDDEKVAVSGKMKNKKIMVEFAHPNTHKEMHIGHMRTLVTGEAISRLCTANGAKVFRANYQGDIGPHVAKALYGIEKMMAEKDLRLDQIEKWIDKDKAHFLGEGYVRGSKDYDKEKLTIDELNTRLYERDPKIMPLYQRTRKWSLEYYEEFYKRFYTRFDKLFFESEVDQLGKKIVLDHLDDVFQKENGAIIFKGEKYGLHTRVFITQAGNPTYEGKEIGNAYKEREAFAFDQKIHIVASEQSGYFKVVFKALELLDPEKFGHKQVHVAMGMVHLSERKMSSRTGDILTVDWLIDQVKEKVRHIMKEGRLENDESEEVIEQITIGAIKYSILRAGTLQDAVFDIEKSVSLEGDSGTYLQYTYARTQSVIRKSGQKDFFLSYNFPLLENELLLLRHLQYFSQVLEEAAENYAPNTLCNYLLVLCQTFNLFYQTCPILISSQKDFRIALTAVVGATLKKGLYLLGISSPERM